jgi:hypothetical protein
MVRGSERRRRPPDPLLGRHQLDRPCGRARRLISQLLSRATKFGCSLFA